MQHAPEAGQILQAVQQGASLKAHRTLDGQKTHKVHLADGTVWVVSAQAVRLLEDRGWLRSNMKFPAATYLLTEAGWQASAAQLRSTRWWSLSRWLSFLYRRIRQIHIYEQFHNN
ncbi:MAG: hypothetical protein KF832_28410 [Caldilineaceae bacterium]|nr:hypothetical protein [Caldilineaceae bacterium]